MPDDNRESERAFFRRILIWTLPLDLGLAGLLAVILMGWEVWTGIGFVIAGALGTLMLIGQHYKIGPDR
jgi:fatty acid desaturase